MDEWERLNANIDSEVHARPFDDTHPECHNEWDLVGPDGVAYQNWGGDCLSAPTMCALRRRRQDEMTVRALEFPDSTGPALPFSSAPSQLPSETDVSQYDNDIGLLGYYPPSSLASPPSNFQPLPASLPQSRAPLGKSCVVEDGTNVGSNVQHGGDEMMGGSTGESRIVYPEQWTEGRIYWWKDRLAARPVTSESDTLVDVVMQEWTEERKAGGAETYFAEGEEKTMYMA